MTGKPVPWTAVYREVLLEERGRIDEWPSEENLLAFSRRELSEPDARSVRRFLTAYPEIAAALAEIDEPFADSPSGEPEDLSDGEIEHDWALLAARIERESKATMEAPRAPSRHNRRPRSARWWAIGSVAAAILAFVLGSFLPGSPFGSPAAPIALRSQLLVPDGQRGKLQAPVPVSTESPEGEGEILLSLGLLDRRAFDDYRLAIHELREGQEVERFRQLGLQRNEAGAFDLLLRRRSLSPGQYRIRLYGRAESGEQLLATYSIALQ